MNKYYRIKIYPLYDCTNVHYLHLTPDKIASLVRKKELATIFNEDIAEDVRKKTEHDLKLLKKETMVVKLSEVKKYEQ